MTCDILVLLNHLSNVTRNLDVFVGCSEISISVTVKHVQNNGLISRLFVYLGELAKFFSVWGPEKIAGLWFAFGEGGGHQYPGWYYVDISTFVELKCGFESFLLELEVMVLSKKIRKCFRSFTHHSPFSFHEFTILLKLKLDFWCYFNVMFSWKFFDMVPKYSTFIHYLRMKLCKSIETFLYDSRLDVLKVKLPARIENL